ncbi:MAG: hypothetical protein JSU75_08965 [Gammaproteobacteria bacterium]|nr:MAG: hypothetical protein JSU75_08965 [Gammaproteobacteria bacterium]
MQKAVKIPGMPGLLLKLRFLLYLSITWLAPASADWINLTGAETSPNIAEIYVLDDHVKLVLEVYVGDLEVFHDLVPDELLKDGGAGRPGVEERMRHFAAERFRFVTGDGRNLPAELILAEPRRRIDRKSPFAGMINPYTRQRVPEAPTDKRVLYAEIHYPFEGRPEELTLIPPLDAEGRALVSIGFIAYHKAVPVIDFRYLGAPARLELDWEDPWYSKFDNPNLKRHHKSALMSYLYVEPYEVRHEILTRVKDLEEWMDLGLESDEYIEIDELDSLKQRVGEFLLTKNPVQIDGEALKPILDRTNFVKVSITGIQLIEKPQRLEISTAIIGVIITYLTGGMPQEVSVDWELFTEQVQQVPATATDPAGPLLTYVTPDDNVHTWTNYLKNYEIPTVRQVDVADTLGEYRIPVGTLICLLAILPLGWVVGKRRRAGKTVVGPGVLILFLISGALVSWSYLPRVSIARPAVMAGMLSEEQAGVLLQALLKNVYRAFDFREEADVYDKLSLSVSGDLLADIYLQNRKSFAVQKAGGAQAKIKAVDILAAAPARRDDRPLAYDIRGNWKAMGTVGHWGHVHMRTNLYDAIVTVEAVDDNWKITGLELLEETRIDAGGRQESGPKQ